MSGRRTAGGVPRVAIVGAGIGGLAAAQALARQAAELGRRIEIALFDAASRAGGCAGTEVFAGAQLERGPDTLVTHKPAGLALCEELGLGSRLEYPGPGAVAVWHRGRLVPVPTGFALVAPTRRRPLLSSPLLSWPGRLRACCEPWIGLRRGAAAVADESVAAFVRRRFGGEVYRRITEPLVGGISMSDVERLSMAASFPRFAALEHQPGRLSGRRPAGQTPQAGPLVAALQGGMGELVDALVASLPAGALRLQTGVRAVRRNEGGYTLELEGAPPFTAQAVIVATPAPRAAAVLRALDPRLADLLESTGYAACATVNLAWPRETLRNPPPFHGFFAPRSAGLPFVAAGLVHAKFPHRVPAELAVVRAFCGGALHREMLEQSDEALAATVAAALAPLVGASGPPEWARLHRHPMSMPQVAVGHLTEVERRLSQAAQHPGLALAGGPLAAYGLPDVIAGGQRAARSIAQELAGAPPAR